MKRIVVCHRCQCKVSINAAERLLNRMYCINCAESINDSFTTQRKSEAARKTSNKRWHPDMGKEIV